MIDSDRWLSPERTAAYLSVRPDALQRLVRQNRIPKPNYALGPRLPRWDRFQLDLTFDGGQASTDPQQASAAIVKKILEEGPARRSQNAGGR
jgi:hypothetical protein